MTVLLRIRGGSQAERQQVLDVLHLRAAVQSVVEEETGIDLALAEAPPALNLPAGVHVEHLPEPSGPEVTGLENDRCIPIAEDLVVRPPWVPAPAGFRGVDLVIPRGMAFGSGEHASTQTALLALHRHWPDGLRSMVDVGCGSGILAAYGALRGGPRLQLFASDVDPVCVRVTAELLPTAVVRQGGADCFEPGSVDLVVANLAGDELHQELPALRRVWSRRAPLVLGGMTVAERAEIEARLAGEPVGRFERDGFVALVYAP